MSYTARVVKVMITSPSDVAKERQLIRDVIQEWNAVHAEDRKVVLMPVGWETHSAPDMGDRPQAIINKQLLESCDLLVGCRWTIVGLIWFFGLDVLIGLRVPDTLALIGPFYATFVVLFAIQLVFVFEPQYRTFGLGFVGPTVFWTVAPLSLFIDAYLSMVAFGFQVYTTIPAARGRGAPECADLEVAESVAGYEVQTPGVRKYEWHRDLVLLDDRSDLMYVTPQMESDGSSHEILAFPRPLIRTVRYHREPGYEVHVLDGWKRLLVGEFWVSNFRRFFSVRDFAKICRST
jgi:hypothetical protein